MNIFNDILIKNRYVAFILVLGLLVSCGKSKVPQTQRSEERQSHKQ
jgi:hypothetical protein